jgi:hypothetical protein
MTSDGLGTMAIARRTGTSKPTVWRWQRRFIDEGVDGLLRDASRPSRIPPLAPELVPRVVAMTLGEPSGEATLGLLGVVTGELLSRHPDLQVPRRVARAHDAVAQGEPLDPEWRQQRFVAGHMAPPLLFDPVGESGLDTRL